MYINPYSNLTKENGAWLKANFHTHAGTGPNTCGAYDLEEVIRLYKEAGYDVLTISNHDLFTDTSKFKEKYDIAMINGFEYSQKRHMLCIGGKSLLKGEHQEVIDNCVKEDGFVIFCHPNWQDKEYWPWDKLDQLKNYCGLEVFNGVISRLGGTGLAEDTWDYLLSQGKLVWGFGNDDFHRWYDLNNTWSMIYSSSKEEKDIKSAIKKGSFYLSTGLYIDEFTFVNNTITVRASENNCYEKRYEYRFIGKKGELLKKEEAIVGEYKLSGEEDYVRIKVIGEQGFVLWTQPIYQESVFVRP